MLELDHITVKGFKSIASIEKLELGPINVLIGPNGSGKSNFIGVFSFLNAIREGRLQDYVIKAGGADRVVHFGARATNELFIRVSFRDGRDQYEIRLEPTDVDELVPRSETVFLWDKAYARPYDEAIGDTGKEAGISKDVTHGVASYVRNRLDSWRLYHFHDTSSNSPMKKTADVNDNRHLRADGSNLPAFLYFLRERHENSYGLITRTVQQVAPFFRDFELEPQQLNPDKIRLEWNHAGTDAYFDASSLSDGTLRFIALV